jgi:hypothetical protein
MRQRGHRHLKYSCTRTRGPRMIRSDGKLTTDRGPRT